MEIRLKIKPQNPIIINGFPGIGLIGTIATEYLIKHLDAKSIGYIWSEDLSPVAAVHDSRVVQPLEIYYAKKRNIIIVHAMTEIKGMEWKISDTLEELYKLLKAKEIISLEGIMGESDKPNSYFYSNISNVSKKLEGKSSPLKEGIIMGVTAALLLKDKSMNTTGIFVETHSKLPDSRSAAKMIEVLDQYIGLDIDYKPLLKAAAEFEDKLKGYVAKVQDAHKTKEDKAVDYMG